MYLNVLLLPTPRVICFRNANCNAFDFVLGLPNDRRAGTCGLDVVAGFFVLFLEGHLHSLGVYPVSWSPGNDL